MDKSIQIDTFSRLTRVSRETILSLIQYEEFLRKANKSLNLIGKSTINDIWTRHFLDSAQVIDFIDKNDKELIDLGSGAGFPGLVIALITKDKKIPLKVQLIEKSPKKGEFLKQVSESLSLNVEVVVKNVLTDQINLNEKIIIARAFKPLKVILELIHKKTKNLKKIFLFLGKTGQNELLQASKNWDIKYKQRMSITNSDSSVIEINKLKKIN